MSLKIGITGGIGTGKTLICKIFQTLGAPILNADQLAKQVMVENEGLKNSLKAEFGENIYFSDGQLNRKLLSSLVFTDKDKLDILNKHVHKVVIEESINWANSQTAPYCVKEAALLFESGSYQHNDFNILVVAPLEIRIKRVMERDQVTREEVIRRIENQWPDDKKKELADFIIINDNQQAILPQVLKLHTQFLNQAAGK